MIIWVDADACPAAIKEILYRSAERTQTKLILVANRVLRIPRSRFVQLLTVSKGLDVADNEICKNVTPGDIVITSDIPLAALIVEKGATGINPRGEVYSPENIRAVLSSRDFMDSLRSSGIETGGPAALSNRERMAFANSLDRTLQKRHK